VSRGKLSKEDLPEDIRGNVEKALEKTGVKWSQLSESQKKQIIGGGKKAQQLYNKYS
jgi:hypothetical protein